MRARASGRHSANSVRTFQNARMRVDSEGDRSAGLPRLFPTRPGGSARVPRDYVLSAASSACQTAHAQSLTNPAPLPDRFSRQGRSTQPTDRTRPASSSLAIALPRSESCGYEGADDRFDRGRQSGGVIASRHRDDAGWGSGSFAGPRSSDADPLSAPDALLGAADGRLPLPGLHARRRAAGGGDVGAAAELRIPR